jgi:uncharacterized protein YdcH (DUF465 family)
MDINHLDLAHEFPELKDRISEMKTGSAHFKKLFDKYSVINREIIRIEQRVDLVSEEYDVQKRKERLALKDELYGMLTARS